MNQANQGILLLDKPVGISSNQALQHVKKIFSVKKAGHGGSLDVLASGMLPIFLGEATKFSQFSLSAEKHYCATAILGFYSTTGDDEGEKIPVASPENVTQAMIEDVLQTFLGKTQQIPSMYSALKHKGQPLYKLARKGIEVERAPREINIRKINLLHYEKNQFTLEVLCSKGTYIRNLVEDIGKKLKCGAYVSALRRLSAGSFLPEQMVTLEELKTTGKSLITYLLPADYVLQQYPQCILSEEEVQRACHGKIIQEHCRHQGLVRLYAGTSEFIGLGLIDEMKALRVKRLMVNQ